MEVLDPTTELGALFASSTLNTTGDVFLTLLAIIIVCVVIGIGFRVPIEIIALCVFPLAIVGMMITSSFIAILGAIAIYISIVFARYLFF